VKQSFINRITLCDKCNTAFIINVEGDENTCDLCLADNELTLELIDEGVLIEMPNDRSQT
jgi:hypothetical protein